VGTGQLTHDSEPKARAEAGSGRVGPEEALEDLVERPGWEAGSVVGDAERDAGRATRHGQRRCRQPDVTAWPKHRQGVVDQVLEDPIDGQAVSREPQFGPGRLRRGGGDLHAGSRGPGFEALDRQIEELCRV